MKVISMIVISFLFVMPRMRLSCPQTSIWQARSSLLSEFGVDAGMRGDKGLVDSRGVIGSEELGVSGGLQVDMELGVDSRVSAESEWISNS